MEPLRDWIEAEPDLFLKQSSRRNGLHDWNARYAAKMIEAVAALQNLRSMTMQWYAIPTLSHLAMMA